MEEWPVDSLVEEWLKTGNDSILDILQAGDEDFIHWALPTQLGFKEGYDAGACRLDIHFRLHGCGFNGQQYRLWARREHCVIDTETHDRSALNGGDQELRIPGCIRWTS